MQPYLFPYIGYFQLMNTVDKFVIYDDVNYINRGWINRNRILSNGREHLFSIPLIGASQNKLINGIEILQDQAFFSKLIRSMTESYKKAPYYSEIFPVIEEILLNKETNLSAFIHFSLHRIKQHIGIPSLIVKSSSIYNNEELKAQNRILDICLKEKAQHYINPIGGKEIYSQDLFENSSVELSFIKTNDIVYSQFKNDFVPGLSIIDVLMFNSIEQIKSLLQNYQLIK
jgi:hypothetical protein